MKKKEEVKALLRQLRAGEENKKLVEKGKKLLKSISPADLAIIEQEIIEEGVTRKEMRKLCDVHLEVMKDSIQSDIKLKPGHPVHTLMEEHKMILGFVDKLRLITTSFTCAKGYGEVKEELELLKHISEHLVEADKHHAREEDALFPALERFGVTEPPEIMREEHVDLKKNKVALYKLARNARKLKYADFVKRLTPISSYICEELPKHIYKEDNILYPMAITVVPAKEWLPIKVKCDRIGYCCFTPAA